MIASGSFANIRSQSIANKERSVKCINYLATFNRAPKNSASLQNHKPRIALGLMRGMWCGRNLTPPHAIKLAGRPAHQLLLIVRYIDMGSACLFVPHPSIYQSIISS